MINLNDKAPDINLNTDNDRFDLKLQKGKKVVVFFFPRADTSGCTAEAIAFSNLKNKFDESNCVLIGISKDSPEKQKKFREKYNLTCLLGADNETDVCEKYGVWVEKSMYGKKYMGIQRSTFIINEEGLITFIWSKVKVPGHAEEVLNKVYQL
tara:strand:+ start:29 stop:487 length:459 start_codon:yes stop_codon:yes gene_type:complete